MIDKTKIQRKTKERQAHINYRIPNSALAFVSFHNYSIKAITLEALRELGWNTNWTKPAEPTSIKVNDAPKKKGARQ